MGDHISITCRQKKTNIGYFCILSPELVFDYHSSNLREINNGHTIQQNRLTISIDHFLE
jgi:hypothetical protein